MCIGGTVFSMLIVWGKEANAGLTFGRAPTG